MSQMTDRLKEVLDQHRQWLANNNAHTDAAQSAGAQSCSTAQGVQADLSGEMLHDLQLSDSDLSGAILTRSVLKRTDFTRTLFRAADLSCADLREADLSLCQFNNAVLEGADLRGAVLQWANLQFAKLHGAKLAGANIKYCVGDGQLIKNIHPHAPWWITYTCDTMAIGCEQHPIEEWKKFPNSRIKLMDDLALPLWRVNKAPIFAAIESFPAEEFRG